MKQTDVRSIRDTAERILKEDMGAGDVTTMSLIPRGTRGTGLFLAKAQGIVAGWEVVREIYRCLDSHVELVINVADGDPCRPGDNLATVRGDAAALLSGERTALNVLQRMSGIAGMTANFVHAVKGTETVILDTRKTSPGIRILDKMAVRLGGGQNHRFGLDDMILIKENHIAICGGVTEAVKRAKERRNEEMMIEVEVKTIDELEEALQAGPDRILLDNMEVQTLARAVRIVGGRIPLEASGNVSLENVRAVAETGIQYISVGRLTHSVQALDVSFVLTVERSD